MTEIDIRHGDCLTVLRDLPDNSVDSVVTDPPYGLSNTKPAQVADVLAAWVTGDTKMVPGLKKDSLEDAFVKALKRSAVTDSDDLDSEAGKEFVSFRVPLGVIPVSMFRPVNLNDNAPSGEKEIDGDGMGLKVEHLLRNDGDTEGGEGVSGNIFRLRRRSNTPCSVSREGDSALIRVSVWLGNNSFTEPEGPSGVMTVGATEVVAMLSLNVGRGTAEFLPADSALPGDFILTRSGAEPVGALTRTGGLPSVLKTGEVSEVDTSADGAGALDVVVGLPMGWHESHSSASKGFMGKTWDGFVPPPAVWAECLRVLKPGGHMAVFAGARTQDLMGLSIRLAGFEIRDTLGWIYGSGFPKSMDVSKAIDKARREDAEPVKAVAKALRAALDASGKTRKEIDAHFGTANVSQYWFSPHRNSQVPPVDKWPWLRDFLGIDSSLDAEVWRLNGRKGTPGEAWEKREVVGVERRFNEPSGIVNIGQGERVEIERKITTPASDAAKRWDGWGTALKPAIEPIILARKPLEGTVAANVLAHGVGGLNIDACRVEATDSQLAEKYASTRNAPPRRNKVFGGDTRGRAGAAPHSAGRFPANVLLDEHAAKEMDRQSGVGVSRSGGQRGTKVLGAMNDDGWQPTPMGRGGHNDSGGASRFFPVFKYQAKAPKRERPVIVREDGTKIQHPTVKPLSLMSWIVTLITPPGGTVLDPFAGTGTTLQAARNKGFRAIGIEQDPDYIQLINARLETAAADGGLF